MRIDSRSKVPRSAQLESQLSSPTPALPKGRPRPSPFEGVSDLRAAYWRRTCFYASPIGKPGSDERRHADLFLESLVRPAIEGLDSSMTVVRADELPTSSISASVVEYVQQSQLVVADLSYHNPNVLYEVGQRHAHEKPFVLISRTEDPIPSNLQDARVVLVNMENVPMFVSEMGARQEQILEYARWALSPEGEDHFRQ